MNTQKIMDKNRNRNQRFQLHISDDTVVFFADFIKCLRRFKGRKRRKQNFRMSVRISGADIVLHGFGATRNGIVHVTVQDFVKLQNIVLRNGNRVKIIVDDVQHITVSGDLLLVTVFRRGFFLNKLSYPCVRGNNALDGV